MTVRPGTDWGEVVLIPADAIELGSDAELAAALDRREAQPLLLRGGDLFRAVGAPSASAPTSVRLPVDVLRVDAGGHTLTAVAHVIARRAGRLGWWRGAILCIMNAEHLGRADVAPRAHPNDGRFDVVEVSASMSLRSRWQAWRRLGTGTHLPHPEIATRRGRREEFRFDRPLMLYVDGVERGVVRSFTVSVVPDAAVIHV